MPAELNDSLADMLDAPMGEVRTAAVRAPTNYTPRDFTEKCAKCNGTGSWRGRGQCFACKGIGKQTFKTSPETRASARQHTAERKVSSLRENIEGFKTAHPDVFQWIESAGTFEFALSMREAIAKFGSLTEGQMNACLKCMNRPRIQANERREREAAAPVIAITKIEEAFAAVADAGLKYPKLSLGTFDFKPASERSKWHGSIYVTEHGEYLGRVTAGKFVCTSACTPIQQDQILEAAADPEAAAIAYGKRTGSCACCRRELTDPESIELGIGPVCMKKWGW